MKIPAAITDDMYALGNDYIQTTDLVVEESYQDGIFTQVAPSAILATTGFNKRIFNVPQEEFKTLVDGAESFSGKTDASATLTKEYATAKVESLTTADTEA